MSTQRPFCNTSCRSERPSEIRRANERRLRPEGRAATRRSVAAHAVGVARGGGGPNFVGHFGEAGVRPIHQPSDTAADTRAGQGTTAEPTAQTVFPPRCRAPPGPLVLIGRLSQPRRDAPKTRLFTAHAKNGSPGFGTTEGAKERTLTLANREGGGVAPQRLKGPLDDVDDYDGPASPLTSLGACGCISADTSRKAETARAPGLINAIVFLSPAKHRIAFRCSLQRSSTETPPFFLLRFFG